jgi:hypothetical protein
MNSIEITTTTISLPDIVRQVSRDRVSLELSVRHIPLARIVPIDGGHSLAELDRAMRECPRLGEDAEAFERMFFLFDRLWGNWMTHDGNPDRYRCIRVIGLRVIDYLGGG